MCIRKIQYTRDATLATPTGKNPTIPVGRLYFACQVWTTDLGLHFAPRPHLTHCSSLQRQYTNWASSLICHRGVAWVPPCGYDAPALGSLPASRCFVLPQCRKHQLCFIYNVISNHSLARTLISSHSLAHVTGRLPFSLPLLYSQRHTPTDELQKQQQTNCKKIFSRTPVIGSPQSSFVLRYIIKIIYFIVRDFRSKLRTYRTKNSAT